MSKYNQPAMPADSKSQNYGGFTKLEQASLMIAQGMVPRWAEGAGSSHGEACAEQCVYFAKAILDKAGE